MPKNKNETTRTLRVIYTDPERLELGKKLAEEHNELGQVNADFDRVKAEFKSKLTAHEAQIVDLANKVSSGYRMEPVKCLWSMDAPSPNSKQLRRLDTFEVVETAEMNEHDKQVELPLTELPLTELGEKLTAAMGGDTKVTVTAGAPLAGIAGDGTVAVEADRP